MPLPDETKAKSARDLIARFQSNINTNSEAPLKPRHSFGSNERFEGGVDNSVNSDISEAKRVPSSRINNARASLEAGLSALSLSRSTSHASSSSSSLSSMTSRDAGVDKRTSTTSAENTSIALADHAAAQSAEEVPIRDVEAASRPTTIIDKQSNATEEEHASKLNAGATPPFKSEEGVSSNDKQAEDAGTHPTRVAQLDDGDAAKNEPATAQHSTTIPETPAKASNNDVTPSKDTNKSPAANKEEVSLMASPALARTRLLTEQTGSPAISPAKASSASKTTSATEDNGSPSSSKALPTSSIVPSSSHASTSKTAQTPAKTPSRSSATKTSRSSTTTSSPVPVSRPTVASPSLTTTPDLRRARPAVSETAESAKKQPPPTVEHASDHSKASSTSARVIGASTPSRNASSSLASTSGSRPTSVMSSFSTAKVRRTPLLATSSSSSSSARRAASEESSSVNRPRSISNSASASTSASAAAARKKALSPAELGRAQAAASTSPPSSSTSSSMLARGRSGLNIPPNPSTTTPAKSPTRSLHTARSGSPATTPTSTATGTDTLSRLMRPTIASQAHARSPVSASSSPSNRITPSSSPASAGGKLKSNAPVALKKTRSYAGTATAGTRAKVSRASLASANTHDEKQENTSSASNGENAAGNDSVRPEEEEEETTKHAEEKEEVPEVENIPDIPTDDEMPTNQEESELQQTAEHAEESSESHSGRAESAPTSSSTIASTPVAETSHDTETSAKPDEGARAAEGITEKVFTGFGPNRPYGKIGLPTEEATPEEAAQRAKDEENKILPVHLRIKQSHDLEEALSSNDDTANSNGDDGDFADKWGTREGSAGLPPLKSPSMLSTKSIEGGESGTGSGSATPSKDNAEVKKVPIWMRKGGEA